MCLVEVWCLRVQAEVVPTYQQIQVVCTCGGAAAQQPSTEEVVTLPGHDRVWEKTERFWVVGSSRSCSPASRSACCRSLELPAVAGWSAIRLPAQQYRLGYLLGRGGPAAFHLGGGDLAGAQPRSV